MSVGRLCTPIPLPIDPLATSVTTIPDNTVQTLTYVDPTDNTNKTCSATCPLLTDSNILYQDFLFNSVEDITGFQLTLSEWQGDGPGLHLLQLLSSGAFASAVPSQNLQSCFAPVASNTSDTGTWTEKQSVTSIAGTTQTVLVSDVDVGTDPSDGPSFTWMPYVSASGNYTVNLLVPGCTNFQDCPLRTSVKVTVFPGGNLNPWVTTVSQTNEDDKAVLIYSGPIVPTTPNFVPTVTMMLADDPTGSGEDGKFELVADRVQFILNSANVTSSNSTSGSNSTGTIVDRGFGFLEWPLSSSTTVSANSAIPTSAVTNLDQAGFDLFTALGGTDSVSPTSASIAASAQHASGVVFLGGQFTLSNGSASGASNIVAFKNGALTALPSSGLNGAVASIAIDGDNVYVGGSFTDTKDASNSALKGIAVYSVSGNKWSSLGGGVDGGVTSLDIADSQLLVAGTFSQVFPSSSSSTGQDASGLAAWDIASSTWVNNGAFLIGSMTFVGNGTSSSTQFVAGSVTSSLEFGASGFVTISNGQDGEPSITPLGVQFDASTSSSNTTASKTRRSHHRRSPTGWIPNFGSLNPFKRRATTSTLAPLPNTPSTPAPAVLAGAFWTNSSSSKEVIVIGGNFSYTSGGVNAQNVAIYDDDSKTVTALKGNQPNGTVRALLVSGNVLYLGGEFAVEGLVGSGFAVYDLAAESWDTTGINPLQDSSAPVVVRSITSSPADDNTVIVAGSFAQAGSTACRAICALDTSSKAWSALGNGIQGEVSSVVYVGVSDGLLSGNV